ncbi:MAG: hypothetical protein IPJ60_16505 [Sphingobacteriaceae bacterium]|nr:hypothetical protein [Sphingobacteriaceae bacterium]
MSHNKTINELSPHLFWDIDVLSLDINSSKRTIIERVIGFGILNDWNWIVSVYGKDQIKETVLTLKNIDKVITLSFLANLLVSLKKISHATQKFSQRTTSGNIKSFNEYSRV